MRLKWLLSSIYVSRQVRSSFVHQAVGRWKVTIVSYGYVGRCDGSDTNLVVGLLCHLTWLHLTCSTASKLACMLRGMCFHIYCCHDHLWRFAALQLLPKLTSSCSSCFPRMQASEDNFDGFIARIINPESDEDAREALVHAHLIILKVSSQLVTQGTFWGRREREPCSTLALKSASASNVPYCVYG